MSEETKPEEHSSGKETAKFEKNLKRLVGLLGGNTLLGKEKLANSDVGAIIADLTKERKEAMAADFKKGALSLIDKYKEFLKFKKQQEDALQKALTEKHKEFNKMSDDLFKIVENIDKLEKDYLDTLNAASTEIPPPPPAPTQTVSL